MGFHVVLDVEVGVGWVEGRQVADGFLEQLEGPGAVFCQVEL